MPSGPNCKTCHHKIGIHQFGLICSLCLEPHHHSHYDVNKPKSGYKKKNVVPSWVCPACQNDKNDDTLLTLANFIPNDDNDNEDGASFSSGDCERLPIPSFKKGQKFGHLNINSIIGKIDELRIFLMQHSFLFCGITETKLNKIDSTTEFNIEGYRLFRFDRETRDTRGGGSCFYIKDDITFLPLQYDVLFPHETEINIVQLFPPFSRPIIVILVYNPPHVQKQQFIEAFESLLHLVIRDNVEYIVLGDLNICLIADSLHKTRLCNVTKSLGATQLIVDPTRVTLSSRTLLDHVYVSFPNKIVESGVFSLTTSDHRFIYCIKNSKFMKSPSEIVQFRSYKNFNVSEIGESLEKADWSSLFNNFDVNSQLDIFESTLISIIDKSCPLLKKRVRGNAAKWMDSECLFLIRKRDNLKNFYDKSPSPELKNEYNKFRNYTKNRISLKKRQYFKNQFKKLESKTIWKAYDQLTGKNIKQSNNVCHLKVNNVSVSDPTKISELFSETFILPDETPVIDKDNLFKSLKSDALSNVDNINITPDNVLECIKKLKLKSSCQDKIPIRMLKPLLPYLVIPLSIFFTTIFNTCTYPNKFKQAVVLPLYKNKGSQLDPNNFRPIASLHSLGKLFEYVLKNKYMPSIEKMNILDNNQHGFRSGRSCTTAWTVFSQYVFSELDKTNHFVVVVFVDMRKGFDSLCNFRLIKMLRDIFKINAKLVLLFANYLNDRYYLIKLGKFISTPFVVNRGIGQGFVNGPNLFILYVNNISECLKNCFYTLLADDLSICISGTDIHKVMNEMNEKLHDLNYWMVDKKLSMNYEKTKYMIIRKKQCKIDLDNLPLLSVQNQNIERVTTYKYLGVVADEFFSFSEHSKAVKQKVCVNVGMLHRLKRNLTPPMLSVLINAYIHSITDYCLTIWGPSRISMFSEIQSKVNQLLVIYSYPKLTKYYSKSYWKVHSDCNTINQAKVECRKLHSSVNIEGLLEKFNLLSLSERLDYFSLWNMFKIKKYGTNVPQIREMFEVKEKVYHTRSYQKPDVIDHNTNFFTKSVCYYSIKLWGSLSTTFLKTLLDSNVALNVRCQLTENIMKKRI
jgi:exonuclease III